MMARATAFCAPLLGVRSLCAAASQAQSAAAPGRPLIGISAAVFPLHASGVGLDTTRVLLIQRGKDPGRGLYCFPGGRQEPRETVAAGCRREVLEETSIAVRTLHERMPSFTTTDVLSGDYHYAILHCLACPLLPGLPQPTARDDALSAAWFPVKDVLAMKKDAVVSFVDEVLALAIATAETRFKDWRPT